MAEVQRHRQRAGDGRSHSRQKEELRNTVHSASGKPELDRNANKQNNIKGNKKSSCCCLSSTGLEKDNVGQRLSRVRGLESAVHAAILPHSS